MNIQAIREEFPFLEKCIYFNSGGQAPAGKFITRELVKDYTLIEQEGPPSPYNNTGKLFDQRREETRAKLAGFFGVSPEEIAFTRGVSDGGAMVFNGLDWREGDELIISDEEHPAFYIPAMLLKKAKGVAVKELELANDSELILARLEQLLSSKTKLVALSEVTTDTGVKLPIPQICHMAHDRSVPVLLDAAQSAGQYPIDVRKNGPDSYAVLGYKWLFGPYGAGLLYLEREQQEKLQIAWTGARAHGHIDREVGDYEVPNSARRYEAGPFGWPLYFALGRATEYLASLGLENIQARVQGLAGYLKGELKAIPRVHVFSPETPELSTGIVAFGIEGLSGKAISERLRAEWNILTRPISIRFDGVRICIAFFTLPEELETLLRAVRSMAG